MIGVDGSIIRGRAIPPGQKGRTRTGSWDGVEIATEGPNYATSGL